MRRELLVLIDDVHAGTLSMSSSGSLSFRYTDGYAAAEGATPLSVNMPLSIRAYTRRVIEPWLWGLLPDRQEIRDRWAQLYRVSADSPFALLAHVGNDVAGAVRFVRAENALSAETGSLRELSAHDMNELISELVSSPATWTAEHAVGHFSLAGAQSKIALRKTATGWARPSGSEPTTHILKPSMPGLTNQAIGEHLCLEAAARIGLNATRSSITHFNGHLTLVVERYDRAVVDGELRRIHQEDCCQALGLYPGDKYSEQLGASAEGIAALLRRELAPGVAEQALWQFVRALAYAWATANTDAHAKNFGLLLSGTQVRLAPLYDLNTVLPYLSDEQRDLPAGSVARQHARLAMGIGGEHRVFALTATHWTALSHALRLEPEAVLTSVREVLTQTPNAWADAVGRLSSSGLSKAEMTWARASSGVVQHHCALMAAALQSGRNVLTRHHRHN